MLANFGVPVSWPIVGRPDLEHRNRDGSFRCLGAKHFHVLIDGRHGEPLGREHRNYEVEQPSALSEILIARTVVRDSRIIWEAPEVEDCHTHSHR
jgi:hypothetical protein